MEKAALAKRTPTLKRHRGISGVLHELFVEHWVLTLMALPAILYVFLFSYVPMFGIILAFKNYTYTKGIFGSEWVGLANFRYLFVSGSIMRVTVNTVLYNIAFMVVGTVLQITAALFFSEILGKYFKKITQTMMLLPFFISWVVAGSIVFNLFSNRYGLINNLLTSMGLAKMDFMNTPSIWPFIIIVFQAWKSIGYGSIVYLANISGIDHEMYEAAEIDGATIFQRIRKITLPLLKPTVVILILLNLGNIVRGDFGMFYNLTGNNALLYKVTDVVDTFVYRSLMNLQNYGMSTAAGLYQSILGFILILLVNFLIKKIQPDYSLF